MVGSNGDRCRARTGPIRPSGRLRGASHGGKPSETGCAAPSPAETVAMARGMEDGLKLLEPKFQGCVGSCAGAGGRRTDWDYMTIRVVRIW